ncbi:MAG: hypothetical protein OXC12_18020 [Spirochaetaceae bacterium]|nr:hypothetical protein [Spirochaetaceae bacterium]
MTIYYYGVERSGPLREALKWIAGIADLTDREYQGRSWRKVMFLEEFDELDDGMYAMDFTHRGERGPGYSEPGEATIGFEMDPGTGFAEQTAAILADGYMAVQFNHVGPRPSSIAQYVEGMTKQQGIKLHHIEDRGALRRFNRSSRHGKLIVGVQPRPSTVARMEGAGLSFAPLVKDAGDRGAKIAEFSFSLGHGSRGRTLTGITEVAESLLVFREDLTKLVATAEDEEGKMEKLDLLEHIASTFIPDEALELSGSTTGYFTYRSRRREMRREFKKWIARL